MKPNILKDFFLKLKNEKCIHVLPGDASILFRGFPDSMSQTLIIASSELEASTEPVLFISTETTPNWWPSHTCFNSRFSRCQLHIFILSSTEPVAIISAFSFSNFDHAQHQIPSSWAPVSLNFLANLKYWFRVFLVLKIWHEYSMDLN